VGGPARGRRWPPSRRTLVVGAVGFILLVAVVWTLLAWRQISVFDDAGGWGMKDVQQPGDSPLYVGMSTQPRSARGTVRIGSAQAVVEKDTGDAVIDFYVCTVDPQSGVGAIGAVHEREVHKECSRLVPAKGATLRLGHRPREQLVMAVQLRRPGVVHVRAADVAYADGWQRGHQQVGGDVVVRRRAETTRKAER
jgi:hypothetical protein